MQDEVLHYSQALHQKKYWWKLQLISIDLNHKIIFLVVTIDYISNYAGFGYGHDKSDYHKLQNIMDVN